MPTSTVEDYIKHLYLEQQRRPDQLVPLGKIAAALGVVPGTVTTMVRALSDAALVNYEPRTGASLTSAGEKLALHVLRRHRLVELFLVQIVGFDWSEVHAEAEELEHVISDKLLEKIDALLGRPSVDPHGDPIPNADGELPRQAHQPLSDCKAGETVRIERVNNQDPQFLRMADELGLLPGSVHRVKRNDRVAGTVAFEKPGGGETVVGTAAATSIFVSRPTALEGVTP